ncbi:Hypothetical predicted protein [Paramuricea clavata]|uniref:Uncharacterized protein n=1 Tax=Paramuricea clavata TaxID=317549 RepID=A0A7D9DPK5_PARCT|nr:Hypothetical predicted protein [Paramuricea clavata]
MEDVLKCVALFYKAGTSGKEYVRKEKFLVKVPRGEDGKEIKLAHLKDIVCVQGGLIEIARQTGLSDFGKESQKKLDLRIGRIDEAGERTSINTDSQMELEMPSIRNHVDKLQVMVYPIEVVFAPKRSTIVIEINGSSKPTSSSYNVTSTGPRLQKVLSEESQQNLNEEHFTKCSEKAKRPQPKRNRLIKDMFARVPPKSKKKDASHLHTKSGDNIDSDIDLSDQERDEV